MPMNDLTPEEMHRLRGEAAARPEDFDQFWVQSLSENDGPLDATFERVDTGLTTLETFDVTFSGYGGARIRAWFSRPALAEHRNGSCIVEFPGYQGGRGHPHEWLFWAAAGYSHLVMDLRGQGGGFKIGATPDPHDDGAPHTAGFLTRGIQDPGSYYYRRVFIDAAHALHLATQAPDVDPDRVFSIGTSQGGGVAVAAAYLVPAVRGLVTAVPFLSSFRRAAEIASTGPYLEIAQYLSSRPGEVDAAFHTLAYFDTANFAPAMDVPSQWVVALHDELCPPSTVLPAARRYAGDVDLRVHQFAGHEEGREVQLSQALDFVASHQGPRLGATAGPTVSASQEHHS